MAEKYSYNPKTQEKVNLILNMPSISQEIKTAWESVLLKERKECVATIFETINATSDPQEAYQKAVETLAELSKSEKNKENLVVLYEHGRPKKNFLQKVNNKEYIEAIMSGQINIDRIDIRINNIIDIKNGAYAIYQDRQWPYRNLFKETLMKFIQNNGYRIQAKDNKLDPRMVDIILEKK